MDEIIRNPEAENNSEKEDKATISRRKFLIGSAAIGGTVLFGNCKNATAAKKEIGV